MAPTASGLLLLTLLLLAPPSAAPDDTDPASLEAADAFDPTGVCYDPEGRAGECMDEEEETPMDVELMARRILLDTRRKFISYIALARDRVPCSRRGYSYYNCANRGRANPYHRSCTAITRCARDLY